MIKGKASQEFIDMLDYITNEFHVGNKVIQNEILAMYDELFSRLIEYYFMTHERNR